MKNEQDHLLIGGKIEKIKQKECISLQHHV